MLATLLLVAIDVTAQSGPPAPYRWTSSGPDHGRIHAMAVAPSNPRVVYAGANSGLLRSDDGGLTWQRRGQLGIVGTLAVDPVDAEVVYAATAFNGVFASRDGGLSWTATSLPWTVSVIRIDPRDPNRVYAGAFCPFIFAKAGADVVYGSGVYRSSDRGVTWENVSPSPASQLCVSSLTLDGDSVYLRADFAVGVSRDRGDTWQLVREAPLPVRALVIDPRTNVRYGLAAQGLVVSQDGGATWTQVQTNLPPAELTALTIDPATGRLFGGSLAGVFRSGDGGRTWARIGEPLRAEIIALHFDGERDVLLAATSKGLWLSNWRDSQWEQAPSGDRSADTRHLAVDPTNPLIVYTSTSRGRIYRTRNGGASWELVENADENPLLITVDARGDLYAIRRAGTTLRRLRKDSEAWEVVTTELQEVLAIAANPRVPGTVYVVEYARLVTLHDGVLSHVGDYSGYDQIVVDPNDPARRYLVGRNGVAVWLGESDDLHELGTFVFVAVAPSNSNILYSIRRGPADQPLLGRSEDRGQTWTDMPITFPNSVNDFVVDPVNPYSVWLATWDAGLLHSTDGGRTFADESPGLPSRRQVDLAFAGRTLHVAVPDFGVWQRSLGRKVRALQQ
ncbi:MAG TPA: hypothetical protein VGF69_14680 [Thermoanaerobaculia bacterium]